jgi:hypothetical protein
VCHTKPFSLDWRAFIAGKVATLPVLPHFTQAEIHLAHAAIPSIMMVGRRSFQGSKPMTIIPIDSDNRIQLPAEWVEALQLRDRVALEQTPDGIVVHACPRATWDEIFATKLVIGSAPANQNEEVALTGDDFLF